MADSDVAIVTVNGRTVRIPKETFQFMLISADVELTRHERAGELDKEPEASSSIFWTRQMLQHMF